MEPSRLVVGSAAALVAALGLGNKLEPRLTALNRLLFDRHELRPCPGERMGGGGVAGVAAAAEAGRMRVLLPLSDRRAAHVARVLQLRDGDTARVGVLDGGVDDAAEVRWVKPPGSSGRWAENAQSEEDSERTRLSLEEIQSFFEREAGNLPEMLELTFKEDLAAALPKPRVDLLLAWQPQARLKNLLPQLAQLGVGTLILVDAARVPHDVFVTKLFTNPDALRDLLVSGLVQSGDTWVPRVVHGGNLRQLLQDGRLDEVAPRATTWRLVASRCGQRMWKLPTPPAWRSRPFTATRRILLAVGPVGGWLQPEETEALAEAGFLPVNAGARPLGAQAVACAGVALAADMLRRTEAEAEAEAATVAAAAAAAAAASA